jgi:preprotein translocase SecF subunit
VERVAGTATELRDEFVGPTIGEELRRKALIALSLALGAQLLYLAVRFRWTYGSAAVATMFHDVLILLGVFAWLGKELDGVFLAALLTVIGYSINDSVVVFDRIREQRRARSREPLVRVANDACLQTIPRTINTGLGALFILGVLYVLGGETLTDFALALLVGIVVGTYSSVFTAAPLAVLLERRRPAPGTTAPSPPLRPAAVRPPARLCPHPRCGLRRSVPRPLPILPGTTGRRRGERCRWWAFLRRGAPSKRPTPSSQAERKEGKPAQVTVPGPGRKSLGPTCGGLPRAAGEPEWVAADKFAGGRTS